MQVSVSGIYTGVGGGGVDWRMGRDEWPEVVGDIFDDDGGMMPTRSGEEYGSSE